MKIVDALIAKFTEKILADMEKIADELEQERDLSPIEDAKQNLINKELYKKLFARQSLLSVLKIF